MTTTNSVADEARGLPKEPTSPWILILVVATVVVWLAVLVRMYAGNRYAEQPDLD